MNSEQQAEDTPLENREIEKIPADHSLTLARKKLAGSDHCLNCGTGLKGPFCDLDSRFMRTLKPLLFRPGRLTRDYMNGRRFRYAPPMRVYIFSSIVFFLLAAFLSSDAISRDKLKVVGNEGFVNIEADSEAERQEVEEALKALPAGVREHVDISEVEVELGEDAKDDGFKLGKIQFNEEPWDRETNPVDIKWLPGWLNDRINDEIEGSPQKAEQINANPNLIVDKVFDILPITMFVLLPVVALIFKIWYLFAKRFYVEHLIFSLHNHAFIFVVLTLLLLAGLVGDLLASSGYASAATSTETLSAIISIWIPVYLLVSLRTVYQQGWFLTLGKFCVIGVSYVTLLSIVTVAVAIASFVLL
jgi:hypothetical protein